MQVRGSIPLFWTQENAQRRLKPDIVLQRFDPLYESTKLHFQVGLLMQSKSLHSVAALAHILPLPKSLSDR